MALIASRLFEIVQSIFKPPKEESSLALGDEDQPAVEFDLSQVEVAVTDSYRPINQLKFAKSLVRAAVFIDHADDRRCLVEEDKQLSEWNGKNRTSVVSKNQLKTGAMSQLYGVTAFLWLRKYQLLVVASTSHLKLLNIRYELKASVFLLNYVYLVEYEEASDEIITCGSRYFAIWKIIKSFKNGVETFSLEGPRIIEVCIKRALYDRKWRKFYGVGHNSFVIIDAKRFQVEKTMRSDLGISDAGYSDRHGVIVTGGYDGFVRVWDVRRGMISQFHAHESEIVGLTMILAKVETDLFATASSDMTVKVWNLESHSCIFSFRTESMPSRLLCLNGGDYALVCDHEVLEFSYQFSYEFVFMTQSPVTELRRDATLLCTCSDGSIRSICPVTFEISAICFPFIKNTRIRHIERLELQMLVLMNEGQMLQIDTSCNPNKLIDIFSPETVWISKKILTSYKTWLQTMKLCSMAYLPQVSHVLFGCENGEIIGLDLKDKSLPKRIKYAHSTSVATIIRQGDFLWTFSSQDQFAKKWRIEIAEDNSGFGELEIRLHLELAIKDISIGPNVTLMGITNLKSFVAVECSTMSEEDNSSVCLIFDNSSTQSLVSVNYPSGAKALDIVEKLGILLVLTADVYLHLYRLSDGTLLKRMLLPFPARTFTVLNGHGDLVFGSNDGLYYLQCYKYLPKDVLEALIHIKLEDDLPAKLLEFDEDVEIWQAIFPETKISASRRRMMRRKTIRLGAESAQQIVQFEVPFDAETRRKEFNRLVKEQKMFRVAKSYEPRWIYHHLSNSGVQWKDVLAKFASFFPDVNFNEELTYQDKAAYFNDKKRFEDITNLWMELYEADLCDDDEFDDEVEDIFDWLNELGECDTPVNESEDEKDLQSDSIETNAELQIYHQKTSPIQQDIQRQMEELRRKKKQLDKFRKYAPITPNSSAFADRFNVPDRKTNLKLKQMQSDKEELEKMRKALQAKREAALLISARKFIRAEEKHILKPDVETIPCEKLTLTFGRTYAGVPTETEYVEQKLLPVAMARVMDIPWFPVIEKVDVTPQDVSDELVVLMKSGTKLIEQRQEAVEALLYLYKELPEEFPNALENPLMPQFEMFSDPEPQIRATVTTAVVHYDVPEERILPYVQMAAADESPPVKEAAAKAIQVLDKKRRGENVSFPFAKPNPLFDQRLKNIQNRRIGGSTSSRDMTTSKRNFNESSSKRSVSESNQRSIRPSTESKLKTQETVEYSSTAASAPKIPQFKANRTSYKKFLKTPQIPVRTKDFKIQLQPKKQQQARPNTYIMQGGKIFPVTKPQ